MVSQVVHSKNCRLTAIASAIFFASGVDHGRPAVEAHRMGVVGLHPGLDGEQDLKHNVNVLPVLTALLMSVLPH